VAEDKGYNAREVWQEINPEPVLSYDFRSCVCTPSADASKQRRNSKYARSAKSARSARRASRVGGVRRARLLHGCQAPCACVLNLTLSANAAYCTSSAREKERGGEEFEGGREGGSC
jgi:hypothetical protein